MKKVIFATIGILFVSTFFVSCTETDLEEESIKTEYEKEKSSKTSAKRIDPGEIQEEDI